MHSWRAILDGKNSATFNMAADAYLLEMAENRESEPVVRLYGWDRPSITLGYHQKIERAIDCNRLGETPVVRRITGGRALLHDDGELTYAVAGNFVDNPVLGKSLHESYNLISQAIVRFYQALGWEATITHRDQPVSLAGSNAMQKGCFASVSQYEIIVRGQKVAAGSQRRTQTSFIQHGAIKIAAPSHHPAIVETMQTIDLDNIKTIPGDREAMSIMLIKEFESIFQKSFHPRPFSEQEKAVIAGLRDRFENLNNGHFRLNSG